MTTPKSPNESPSDEALAALYKEALNHDAPSLELDNAILAAAHKAAGAKPQATNPKRSFTRRWQLPMSIAATVIISASLVLLTPHENPSLLPPTMHNAPVAPPIAASSAPVESVAIEAKTKLAINETQDKKTQIIVRQNEPVNAKPFSDSPEPTLAAVAATAETPAVEDPSQLAQSDQAAAAPAASQTETSARKMARAIPDEKVLGDSEMASSHDQTKIGTLKKEDTDIKVREKLLEDSPESWLKNIDDLRQKGELESAHKSLKSFKLRYPDYKLPKDLMEFEK